MNIPSIHSPLRSLHNSWQIHDLKKKKKKSKSLNLNYSKKKNLFSRSVSPSPWLQTRGGRNKENKWPLRPRYLYQPPSFLSLSHLNSQTNNQYSKDAFISSLPIPNLAVTLTILIFISALSIMTSFANSIACFFCSLNPVAFYTPAPKNSLCLFSHRHYTFLITFLWWSFLWLFLLSKFLNCEFPKPQLVVSLHSPSSWLTNFIF